MKATIKDKESLERALVEEGGLDANIVSVPYSRYYGCQLNRESSPNMYYCIYDNKRFTAFLASDGSALEVCAKDNIDVLVEAFTKIVGYKPFARYIHQKSNSSTTIEWNRIDSNKRGTTALLGLNLNAN